MKRNVYDVNIHSCIFLKDKVIYENTKHHEWEVSLKRHEKAFLLTVNDRALNDGEERSDLEALIESVGSVYSQIVLRFEQDGSMRVDNKEDIRSRWEDIRKSVIGRYGNGEELEALLETVETGLQDMESQIAANLTFFILLSVFSRHTSFRIHTDSPLSMGDTVDLTVQRHEPPYDETDVRGTLIQEGEGCLHEPALFRERYEKDAGLSDGVPFDYRFRFRTEYDYDRIAGEMFDNAAAVISEQASENYRYRCDIAFRSVDTSSSSESWQNNM